MKLVILDRDGVINEDSPDYIRTPAEWVPIPRSLEAISRLHREGYRVVIATNQSGIGRGFFDLDTLGRIHAKMLDAIRSKGGEVDAIFFCPHRPEDGCHCRKPLPGLFEEIAERLKVNLTGAYAVGDCERDLQAARAASAQPILVRTGKGKLVLKRGAADIDVPIFNDLADFTTALLSGTV